MASVMVLELRHPTIRMLWGHGGQSKRKKQERNMLRTSRRNPNISVHVMMEGILTSTKHLWHQQSLRSYSWKLIRSHTWIHKGVHGCFIGSVVEHYRCYKVYINNTIAERIADTMEFFPEKTTMPGIFSSDTATHVETDLIIVLKNPPPDASFAPLNTEKLMHLENWQASYKKKSQKRQNLRQIKLRPKKWNKIKTWPSHLWGYRLKKWPY